MGVQLCDPVVLVFGEARNVSENDVEVRTMVGCCLGDLARFGECRAAILRAR